jgi:hypothetical protein
MTLTDLIKNINYNLRGTDDDAPVLGDPDWVYWGTVANRKKNEMYGDTKKKWASSFATKKVGVIAAGINTFNLDDSDSANKLSGFIQPAKRAYVLRLDGTRHYIDIVKPQFAHYMQKQVYVSGLNPKVVNLSYSVVLGDADIGGSLYVPGYWLPADMDLTSATATVPCDDPYWLSMASAADVAFNEITYDDKFADLNGKANVLYGQMSHANRAIHAGDVQFTPTRVQHRIRGYR